jgi:hypothetical protein
MLPDLISLQALRGAAAKAFTFFGVIGMAESIP